MTPLYMTPGTTLESLVTEVLPALHGRLVGEGGPDDAFVVTVRIDGRGSWTIQIRGRDMRVEDGEAPHPTLWMYMTEAAAEGFLQDALGPKGFFPMVGVIASGPEQKHGVVTLSDPRLIKRVAMANGRIELALVDRDGGRKSVVFGFGDAARRPLDAVAPDAVAEGPAATLERVFRGELSPVEALSDGNVTVRGSRLMVMQLALALAPFFTPTR